MLCVSSICRGPCCCMCTVPNALPLASLANPKTQPPAHSVQPLHCGSQCGTCCPAYRSSHHAAAARMGKASRGTSKFPAARPHMIDRAKSGCKDGRPGYLVRLTPPWPIIWQTRGWFVSWLSLVAPLKFTSSMNGLWCRAAHILKSFSLQWRPCCSPCCRPCGPCCGPC